MAYRLTSIVGERYGRLTVLGEGEDYVSSSGKHACRWRCRCVCGNTVLMRSASLRNGNTTSCGCYARAQRIRRCTTHGLKRHPLYGTWSGMCVRCSSKCGIRSIHRYYDRGIRVCDEWKTDVKAFINWAETNGWKPGLQIDRRDNNENYCPENCRFVTHAVNNKNKGKYKNNTSGHTGVSWNKRSKKWQVQVKIDKKSYFGGLYTAIEDAVTARDILISNN